MLPHGKILLVANPTSQSGRGADAAHVAATDLRRLLGADALDVIMTRYAGHAREIAANLSKEYNTLVVLGGDGVIHEVVNGLMTLPACDRPVVGVIPVGSGNDYAQSINMPADVSEAVRRLVRGNRKFVDIGCVNGEYFMETLSFGVDAGIALDTVERRKKTKAKGFPLFLASGIDQLFHHLELYSYTAKFFGVSGEQRNRRLSQVISIPERGGREVEDAAAKSCGDDGSVTAAVDVAESNSGIELDSDTKSDSSTELDSDTKSDSNTESASVEKVSEECEEETAAQPSVSASRYDDVEVAGESFLMAVNIGPTYGGGFRVAPKASLNDGLFDICIAHPPLSVPYATMVFLLAKNGNHTGFKQIESFQAQEIEVSFDRDLPIQVDGEPLPMADSYHVFMFPSAIEVIVG